MDNVFSKVVAILRCFTEKENDEIHRMLVTDGLDPRTAEKLVVLLPMAYCRILLADSGAKFPTTFCRRLPDARISAEQPLSSEPLWERAVEYARAEIERGVSPNDLLAVAGRSAEFDAANQMLHKGSKLADIIFTPSVLIWPEDGPDNDISV